MENHENTEMQEKLIALGKKIYTARKALKMSRAELGKLVDLHETTVKRYEDGQIKSPNFAKIEAFAEALHVQTQDLIDTWIPGKANDKDKRLYTIFRPIDEENFYEWGELLKLYLTITDEGQAKVREYAKDLSTHPDYKRTEPLPGAFHYKEIE